jgi:hypothetical protein
MTTSSQAHDTVAAEVLKLEEQRCRAIAERDLSTLAPLLGPDLVLTHMNGRIDDKDAFLAARASNPPFATESQDPRVQVYGDTAVITGRQTLSFAGRDPVEAQVTQVWVKRDPSWQQVVFHATRVQA